MRKDCGLRVLSRGVNGNYSDKEEDEPRKSTKGTISSNKEKYLFVFLVLLCGYPQLLTINVLP